MLACIPYTSCSWVCIYLLGMISYIVADSSGSWQSFFQQKTWRIKNAAEIQMDQDIKSDMLMSMEPSFVNGST